jgi:hypothetical protein
MKALFGTVSLLVALAIVGLIAVRQMRAAPPAATGTAPSPLAAGTPAHEQSRALQQRVTDDVARALEQGAAARREADEP